MTNPRDPRRDEIAARDAEYLADPSRCDASMCGDFVTTKRRDGEPAYCSDACKSRAYRERKAGPS